MAELEEVDCIVAGAGVVGLAVARQMALSGYEVIVVEPHTQVGAETSARNSEVIHSGIYYPTDSIKAKACVEGRMLLYKYCHDFNIPHRRVGKLIVAADQAELEQLTALRKKGEANGVSDLIELDHRSTVQLEPNLIKAAGALLSPSTGIIDSHAFIQSLLGELEKNGGCVAYGSHVTGAEVCHDGSIVSVKRGAETTRIKTRNFINAAGHGAPILAANCKGYFKDALPAQYFARGVYFSYSGAPPFQRLVYPLPEPGGLGTHATIDMGGQCRFGPDVEWVSGLDYTLDPLRIEMFLQSICRYWDGIDPDRLVPAFAGVRPKISGPGAPSADFTILGEQDHGLQGQVHLFGIESPGLTSCLSLADIVTRIIT